MAYPSGDRNARRRLPLLIAMLEAAGRRRRTAGRARGARDWFRRHPELRDHVTRRYATLADRPDAGVVYDLTTAGAAAGRSWPRSTRSGELEARAILDWTDHDLANELPGFTTFVPPEGRCPVLRRQRRDRRHDGRAHTTEATRVASVAVIIVGADAGQLAVLDVATIGEPHGHAVPIAVDAPGDDTRLARLIERAMESAGAVRLDLDSPARPRWSCCSSLACCPARQPRDLRRRGARASRFGGGDQGDRP
ncbi:MAG: hypothetical protein R2695_13605 [Acidimicrobiales bacterium]